MIVNPALRLFLALCLLNNADHRIGLPYQVYAQ